MAGTVLAKPDHDSLCVRPEEGRHTVGDSDRFATPQTLKMVEIGRAAIKFPVHARWPVSTLTLLVRQFIDDLLHKIFDRGILQDKSFDTRRILKLNGKYNIALGLQPDNDYVKQRLLLLLLLLLLRHQASLRSALRHQAMVIGKGTKQSMKTRSVMIAIRMRAAPSCSVSSPACGWRTRSSRTASSTL